MNNQRDKITGILMYHNEVFFQVIEGERAVVDLCYARILRDDRHHGLSPILDNTIESLTFPDWSMEYCGPDEVRGHTHRSLQALADLQDKNEAMDMGSLALDLAQKIFESRQVRLNE